MEGAYCQEMKNDVMHRCVFMEIIEHLGELNSSKQHEHDGCVKLNTSNEAKEVYKMKMKWYNCGREREVDLLLVSPVIGERLS